MLPVQPLLEELGRRLRAAREASGLSLAELARRSGLSRRYVTEAEAGRANPSIAKLAQLAATLQTPLGQLCDLSLTGARERVALVGLRGAGKSAVGRRLALALEVPLIELDAEVEELAGMSLAQLFDLQGEETYRRLERDALEHVLGAGSRSVIAAGGSIVSSEPTYARLREACRTIWLSASPEEHFQRVLDQGDGRPMAGRPRAMDELRALLERRAPFYEQCDLHLSTSGRSADQVAELALDWLRQPAG